MSIKLTPEQERRFQRDVLGTLVLGVFLGLGILLGVVGAEYLGPLHWTLRLLVAALGALFWVFLMGVAMLLLFGRDKAEKEES